MNLSNMGNSMTPGQGFFPGSLLGALVGLLLGVVQKSIPFHDVKIEMKSNHSFKYNT